MLQDILDKCKYDMAIAEFLGAVFIQHYAYNKDTNMSGMYAEFPNDKEAKANWHEGKSFHGIAYLKYKTDWNWLEKAVQKIESLGFLVVVGFKDDEHFKTNIYYNGYDSIIKEKYAEAGKSYNTGLITGYDESKIISVYNTVIKFIEFYKTLNR